MSQPTTQPTSGMTPGMHVQPSPITVAAGVAKTAAGDVVVIQIESVTGSSTFFLDPASAKALGHDLANLAGQAQTGIVIPRPGQVQL